MSSSRPRLLVSGDTDESASQFFRIMGDSVELVPPGIPGAEADGVLFAGEWAKRTQDLQLCAQGFLDSVPDALVLVDSENKV
ncbi:MAG: hypothetical protein GY758_23590, partial [Fuerstiella sp.]|nr:hypothetical protein [Fuerstiella sp.]